MTKTNRRRLDLLARLAGLAVTVTCLGGCAQRWIPDRPLTQPADGTPRAQRIDDILARAHAHGYVADEVDAAQGYLRFRAKLGDGGTIIHGPAPRGAAWQVSHGTSTQSWFVVEVESDGKATVYAAGFRTRTEDGEIHRKLEQERIRFAAAIALTRDDAS